MLLYKGSDTGSGSGTLAPWHHGLVYGSDVNHNKPTPVKASHLRISDHILNDLIRDLINELKIL